MSSHEPGDPATNEPGPMASPEPIVPESLQRTEAQHHALIALHNALVALDKLIRDLFMERRHLRVQISQQRVVLEGQLDLLEETDSRIDELQLLWDIMATRFGLRSNNEADLE